jgi:hypothetical protein
LVRKAYRRKAGRLRALEVLAFVLLEEEDPSLMSAPNAWSIMPGRA